MPFLPVALLYNAQLAAVHEVTDGLKSPEEDTNIPTPTNIDTFHFVEHDSQGIA